MLRHPKDLCTCAPERIRYIWIFEFFNQATLKFFSRSFQNDLQKVKMHPNFKKRFQNTLRKHQQTKSKSPEADQPTVNRTEWKRNLVWFSEHPLWYPKIPKTFRLVLVKPLDGNKHKNKISLIQQCVYLTWEDKIRENTFQFEKRFSEEFFSSTRNYSIHSQRSFEVFN